MEKEIEKMRALKAEGLPNSTISKMVGFSDKTVAYHITPGAKAKRREATTKWSGKPGGRLRKKLSDFNKSFSVSTKKTVSEKTQKHYDSKPNMRIYKKLYGFLNKKGGIMAEYREVLEKLWPGEDNENRTEFKTVCALSGRVIDLNRTEPHKHELNKSDCGAFDHELPRDRGGSNDISNLQPLHSQINYIKHNLTNKELVGVCREILVCQGYQVVKIN
tara:strand:+ start:94 stop:747 length:654 start_codon:yes stop_codon:yes gene_type:complete